MRSGDAAFHVIDIGAGIKPWSLPVADALVDRLDIVSAVDDCWTRMTEHWPELLSYPDINVSQVCCLHQIEGCFDSQITYERCCYSSSRKPREPLQLFPVDLMDPGSYEGILAHVAVHGRFDFAICTRVLQGVVRPQTILDFLPAIAKAAVLTAYQDEMDESS